MARKIVMCICLLIYIFCLYKIGEIDKTAQYWAIGAATSVIGYMNCFK